MNYCLITPYIQEIFLDIQMLCKMCNTETPRHFELSRLEAHGYNRDILLFYYGRIDIYQDFVHLKIKVDTALMEKFNFNKESKLLLSYDCYPLSTNIGSIMEFNIKYDENYMSTIEIIREILNNYLN